MIRVGRPLALAMLLAAIARPVWAAGDEEDDKPASDEESDEESDEDTSDEEPDSSDTEDKTDKSEKAEKAEKAGKGDSAESSDEEEATDDEGLPVKQNLNGHDLANTKKEKGEFERDRFFVDKVDDEKTEKGTLVQGSIASSTFFYGESGGAYPNLTGPADNSDAGNKRLFTELRLQTDFRHISGSRWEARLDARARAVNHPDNETFADGAGTTQTTTPNRIQAGLYGENEYELRELWLIHSGERADTYIGRQFIPDLGGIKIDGLRVDYAKSSKVTLLGFGGLMPVRGSRSLTTDYPKLRTALDPKTGMSAPAGRYVAAGGFGAAYRTVSAYGALGAVTQLPLKLSAEKPRLYVTTNGYLRSGPSLDVYHYVLVDLYGSSAENATGKIQLTNLSGGLNFKPNARLRLTAAFHRVDTETLNVQAGAFLSQSDPAGVGNTVIQNEAYLQRIATNTARAGVSAGLGQQQRFELSTAFSYRVRPSFTLTSFDKTVQVDLPKASSVEVWASFVDRHSIKDARIGLEVSRSFGVGDLAYQRSIALITRLFVRRDFADGRGEWEAEAGYSDIRDTVLAKGSLGCGTDMMTGNPLYYECYGTSNNTLVSAGGELFYRLKKDWMTIATLYLLRTTNKRSDAVEDPAITGLTGFLRIAKRF